VGCGGCCRGATCTVRGTYPGLLAALLPSHFFWMKFTTPTTPFTEPPHHRCFLSDCMQKLGTCYSVCWPTIACILGHDKFALSCYMASCCASGPKLKEKAPARPARGTTTQNPWKPILASDVSAVGVRGSTRPAPLPWRPPAVAGWQPPDSCTTGPPAGEVRDLTAGGAGLASGRAWRHQRAYSWVGRWRQNKKLGCGPLKVKLCRPIIDASTSPVR
jgi:hypothetical protein